MGQAPSSAASASAGAAAPLPCFAPSSSAGVCAGSGAAVSLPHLNSSEKWDRAGCPDWDLYEHALQQVYREQGRAPTPDFAAQDAEEADGFAAGLRPSPRAAVS